MRTNSFSRIAVLAVATGLGALLFAPIAGFAETPEYAPAPADVPATRHIMGSGGLGNSPDEAIIALAPFAASTWDETSGYAAVESVRATLALPTAATAITNQVPSDVRWAPVVASGAVTTRHIMGSGGLGSPQETIDVLAPVAAPKWEEATGFRMMEAARVIVAVPAPIPTDVLIPTRHVMGSGGLGSSQVETMIVLQPVAIS